MELIIEKLNWQKMNDLIPAVIQDVDTLQVLMLGYMNIESLKATIENKKVTFYSRSKQRLWEKGETSNNFLKPIKIITDCDQDSILILAKPNGHTCHLGNQSCFKESDSNFLSQLEQIIDERYKTRPTNSYTSELFNSGIKRIAQKIGEEGVEVALSSISDSKPEFLNEASDLIYHLLVLLRAKDSNLSEVIETLKYRRNKSMKKSIQRVLISVSDKTGIVEFAKKLAGNGTEIISTGGTANALKQAGIDVKLVSELTGFPEIMDGRVKTLHPLIYGGILGKRDLHQKEATEHNIEWIDLVVCNLYPFAEVIKNPQTTLDKAIENIDIGGPSMIRAASKNFNDVGVIVDPNDYQKVLDEILSPNGLSLEMRKKLSTKAFAHTSQYDAIIQQYLNEEEYPDILNMTFNKSDALRYGENPHQTACSYVEALQKETGALTSNIIQGKKLSYNNIADANSAINCLIEFKEPTCVVVKHANPCGVAVSDNIDDAFMQGFYADEKSAFGGIVTLNRKCTKAIAEKLSKIFVEIVIAYGFEEEALLLFKEKPNLRLIDLGKEPVKRARYQFKSVNDGVLIQSSDIKEITRDDLKIVTKTIPTENTIKTMLFGWKVLKHVKSNAIIVVKDNVTLGIGAGQTSRINSVEIAISKSVNDLRQAVLASDAFFPFSDSIDQIAKTDIKAIIQPGGSVKDDEVIKACDEHGIAMVFTGFRCFNH